MQRSLPEKIGRRRGKAAENEIFARTDMVSVPRSRIGTAACVQRRGVTHRTIDGESVERMADQCFSADVPKANSVGIPYKLSGKRNTDRIVRNTRVLQCTRLPHWQQEDRLRNHVGTRGCGEIKRTPGNDQYALGRSNVDIGGRPRIGRRMYCMWSATPPDTPSGNRRRCRNGRYRINRRQHDRSARYHPLAACELVPHPRNVRFTIKRLLRCHHRHF